MRSFALLSVLFVFGCSQYTLYEPLVATDQGYRATFPGEVFTVQGRDGPVEYRVDAAKTVDGARFEVAWHRLPQDLDAQERRLLLTHVIRGLKGWDGELEHRSPKPSKTTDAVDLIYYHPQDGNRRVYHRVMYPTSRTMVQISVAGAKDGEWENHVAAFMRSLVLTIQEPRLQRRTPLDPSPKEKKR